MDTEPLPEHICELLQMTMLDVYGGRDDTGGPPRSALGRRQEPDAPGCGAPGWPPTTPVLQEMFDLAFTYAKFTSSWGSRRASRCRRPSSPISTCRARRACPPPGAGANPSTAKPMTVLDILLAILAFAIYLAELAVWVATVLPSILTQLATWPLRELLFQLLVVPAWDLYLVCRKPLVLEGFLSPKTSEISTGLVCSGPTSRGPSIQLRADLDAPTGFAAAMNMAEPSGLDPMPTAPTGGYSLDPAYPRACSPTSTRRGFDKAGIDSAPCPASTWRRGAIPSTTWPGCGTAGRRRAPTWGRTCRARWSTS